MSKPDSTPDIHEDLAVQPSSNDYAGLKALPKSGPKVGQVMPDGTVYAGISPDTGNPMYAAPRDAPTTCTFSCAYQYAVKLHAYGHKDWRVPTDGELNVLYQNRAALGGFDETGSYPAGWYWSSSKHAYYDVWGRRFSDGYQLIYYTTSLSSLRCVRG